MKISYIKLVNHKRFPLRDDPIVEATFTQNTTMISGINGSGKTNLLNELTPLPSDKTAYHKNGYKEIHIDHKGQNYKVISDFTDGVKYYFYVNDENLNTANNITTQRDLVYQHFGITQIYHDLMTGIETFTNMSLINRKKLFNGITHLNIDAILENYNELNEELKNNEYLLKTQMSLLQSEEQKLLDKNRYESLQLHQKQMKEMIDYLLDFRMNLVKYDQSSEQIEDTTIQYKIIVDKIQDYLSKHYTYLTSYRYTDEGDFKNQVDLVSYKLDQHYELLESKEKELKIIIENQNTDIDQIKSEVNRLQLQKKNLQEGLTYLDTTLDNLEEVRNYIYSLESSLLEILSEIPLNEDKVYSKEKYEQLLLLKNKLLEEQTKLLAEELELKKKIDHFNQHKENIQCPQCHFTWESTEHNETYDRVKENLKKVSLTMTNKQVLIKDTDIKIQNMIEYFNIYRTYSNARKSTYLYFPKFWNQIDTEELIFKEPRQILVHLKTLVHDVVSVEQYQILNKQLIELETKLKTLSNLQVNNKNELEYQIKGILEDIHELQDQKRDLIIHLKNSQFYLLLQKTLNSFYNEQNRSRNDLFSSSVSFSVQSVINELDIELSKYKVSLLEIEKELIQYTTVSSIVEKYQKQIEETQLNVKMITLILNELSPKNGLIAKSVSSFLNVIINNLNKVIHKVWDYRMVIKPIDVESEVLNYRFKVDVEDKIVIDDINKVSAGMREVINLSFKIVLYILLKFDNYPLYLDELASAMDSNHSSKVFNYIYELSRQGKFSQVFLITHKEKLNYMTDMDIIEL